MHTQVHQQRFHCRMYSYITVLLCVFQIDRVIAILLLIVSLLEILVACGTAMICCRTIFCPKDVGTHIGLLGGRYDKSSTSVL